MVDVIDLLEVLGADADLVRGTGASFDALLEREGVEPVLRSALLEGDAGVLQRLLRAPNNVCCLINPAEPDEDEEDEEDEEQDEEGADENDMMNDADDAGFAKGPNPRG